MTTTTPTKPIATIDELRKARFLSIIGPHGSQQRSERVRIHGEHLIFQSQAAGERGLALGNIHSLREQGWTIEVDPSCKMIDEIGHKGEYSIRSWFRGHNIFLTDHALANVCRTIGLIEGLRLGDREMASNWLLVEFHRAMLYLASDRYIQLEGAGQCLGQRGAPANRLVMNGEDDFSFGFAIYRPVAPKTFNEAIKEKREQDSDLDYFQAKTLVCKAMRIQDEDVSTNVNITYRYGHEQVHYAYGWNGGIIARFDTDNKKEWEMDKFPDSRAWSIHS